MQIHKKSALTMVLIIVFLCTNTIFAFAQPSDIEGHWAKDVIEKWAGYGIIKGSEGLYRPSSNISRAEFVVMISRVLKPLVKGNTSFSDVLDKQWYTEDVLKAVEAGFIQGDGKGNFKPTADITRQEAAVVLYKAFDMKAGNTSALNLFKDNSQVADWAKDAVAALVENSYLTGKAGMLAPLDKISRAETVKLINSIAGELKDKADTYTGNVEGSLVINTPGVILKDMTIKGNLYIAQGVGDGDVDLDNVTVMGKTIVKGGGENSIRIKNSNLNGTLVVIKKNGKVRIILIENSSVANVELKGAAKLGQENLKGIGFGNVTVMPLAAGAEIVIEGDIKELMIEAPNTDINVIDGTVGKFTVATTATNTTVEIAKQATVKTLTVEAKSEITGTGTIEKTDIKVEDVKIDDKLTTPETPATTPTGPTGPTGPGSSTPKDDDDDTPSYVYLTGVELNVGGLKPATGNGKIYSIDLTNTTTYPNTAKISEIKMTAPTGSKLVVTSVVSANGTNVTMSREFTLPNVIAVTELLGSNSDVSLGSMRAFFGNSVTVNGILSLTGYSSLAVSFTMNLGTSPEANIPNQWVDVTTSGTTVTAKIKAGKGSTTLASIGIASFLSETVGELPEEVTIGTAVCKVTDSDYYGNIKTALKNVVGKADWSNVTLSNLVGKSITFKKSGDAKIYTVVVE